MAIPYSDFDSYIDELSPREFEEFVADLWEEFGYETTVTKQSGDRGKDVIAQQQYPAEETIHIQAKAHSESNKVRSGTIQKSAGLYQQGADHVIVVTTSEFTEPARNLSSEVDVELKDRQDIYELVQEASFDIGHEISGQGTASSTDEIDEVPSEAPPPPPQEPIQDVPIRSETSTETSQSTNQSDTHTEANQSTNRSNTRIKVEPESAYRLFKTESEAVKKYDPDESGVLTTDSCPNCQKELNFFHRFSPYTFSGEGSSRDRYFELTPPDANEIVALQQIYGFPCCGAIYHIKNGNLTKLVESDAPVSDNNRLIRPIKYIHNKLF